MQLSEPEFQHIVKYVKDRYGIELGRKRVLIAGRLENYLLREGYESYGQYIEEVEKNPAGKEAGKLINVLTTNHTYFMREFEHMDYLKRVVLPWIMNVQRGKGRDVRIWSAASSTGEEPYTIQMVLQDFFSLDEGWDTQILATDISTKVLQKAKNGVYLEEQIRPLPENWKRHYLHKVGEDQYQMKEELREKIVFRQFNLMDEIPFRGLFHVVFLRNVMIYFDEETKRKLLDRIYEHIVAGGYLFIGTTESIGEITSHFQCLQPSVYRKVK
ncbi:MAG: protein-glutamate O-methyltransferase CheR [Lachnospiraceae bacterium]|nr:protein-glutamate O-methyltransferase CheR [Lachnospiraceae bacterium]